MSWQSEASYTNVCYRYYAFPLPPLNIWINFYCLELLHHNAAHFWSTPFRRTGAAILLYFWWLFLRPFNSVNDLILLPSAQPFQNKAESLYGFYESSVFTCVQCSLQTHFNCLGFMTWCIHPEFVIRFCIIAHFCLAFPKLTGTIYSTL